MVGQSVSVELLFARLELGGNGKLAESGRGTGKLGGRETLCAEVNTRTEVCLGGIWREGAYGCWCWFGYLGIKMFDYFI